jgi:hypothetical protein
MVKVDIEKKLFTIAGYLEKEDTSETRHEFQDETITEIAGGILPHNVIKLYSPCTRSNCGFLWKKFTRCRSDCRSRIGN